MNKSHVFFCEHTAVPSPFAESWVPLERKKKPRGELRIMTHVQRAADGDKYSFEAKYQMGKEIGRGGFSVVYEATNKETGKVVAVKVIDKKKQDDEQLVLLQREISIMKKLDHPNIVKLYDVYDEEKTISLVIELFVSTHTRTCFVCRMFTFFGDCESTASAEESFTTRL